MPGSPPDQLASPARVAELEELVAGRDQRISELAGALFDERERATELEAQRDEAREQRDWLDREWRASSATLEMILATRVWRLGTRWYAFTAKLRGHHRTP